MRDKIKERDRKRRWRAANPDKLQAEIKRTLVRRRANAAHWLLSRAKARAENAGIHFDLTAADITVPEFCPVLGLPLALGGNREDSPTIDRLIPALGYTPGNVRVISYRANRIKTDASLEELRSLVRYLETNLAGTGQTEGRDTSGYP